MGSTEQYLVLPESAAESRQKAIRDGANECVGNGWAVLHWNLREVSVDRLVQRVESAADKEMVPALGGFIEDSDYVFLAWTDGNTQTSHKTVVGSENAPSYSEGIKALAQADHSVAAVVNALSAWSRMAPKRIGTKKAATLLDCPELELDGFLPSLLAAIGLSVSQWPPRAFAEAIDLDDSREAQELRFVYGYGDDFAGVWDRQTPGPPLRRFPKTREGAELAMREAVILSMPSKKHPSGSE